MHRTNTRSSALHMHSFPLHNTKFHCYLSCNHQRKGNLHKCIFVHSLVCRALLPFWPPFIELAKLRYKFPTLLSSFSVLYRKTALMYISGSTMTSTIAGLEEFRASVMAVSSFSGSETRTPNAPEELAISAMFGLVKLTLYSG